jgi:hypothetical protein
MVVLDAPAGAMDNLTVTLKNKGAVKEGSKNKDVDNARVNTISSNAPQTIAGRVESRKVPTTMEARQSIEVTHVVNVATPDLNVKEILIYRAL